MVGDLKQSIYRFRGGDPTIFKKNTVLTVINRNYTPFTELQKSYAGYRQYKRRVQI